MIQSNFFKLLAIAASVSSERVYPAGCVGPSFPGNVLVTKDEKKCAETNWNLGIPDKCAPKGPYPVTNEQVYIQDPNNFCMLLPDPASPVLKAKYYNLGKLPTIVAGEGYVQSFCVGITNTFKI